MVSAFCRRAIERTYWQVAGVPRPDPAFELFESPSRREKVDGCPLVWPWILVLGQMLVVPALALPSGCMSIDMCLALCTCLADVSGFVP